MNKIFSLFKIQLMYAIILFDHKLFNYIVNTRKYGDKIKLIAFKTSKVFYVHFRSECQIFVQ